ncbi:MAG: exodeoxyribonuclease V subunit alpha [Burkholderiaceae bacterium]
MSDERAATLQTIVEWTARGWLRPLDAALARFVAEVSPSADGPVLLAAGLVANLEGQGHTCLVLDELLHAPGRAMRWSDDASDALDRLLAAMSRSRADWTRVLAGCDAVHVDDGRSNDGGEPLVLSGDRLYLRRYWRHERRVAAHVKARTTTVDAVEDAMVRRWLDRLFPARADDDIDWQKVACAIALRGRLSIITGGPGTGKTFSAARFIALLYATAPDAERLRIVLAAPTGKAAARLRQSIDGALAQLQERLGETLPLTDLAARIGPAKTLHALLGTRPATRRFRHDASNPLDVDVVIVDEASMVHIEMMDALLDALPATSRVLLLGDKDQLASVEAGAVLGELCRDADAGRYTRSTVRYVEATTGADVPAALIDAAGPALAQQTVMLRRSQRFGGDIDTLARAVNGGDVDAAASLLLAAPDGVVAWPAAVSPDAVVDLASLGRPGATGGYRTYLELLARRSAAIDGHAAWARAVIEAFGTFRILCALRAGDWGVQCINRSVAERLAADGLLSSGHEWYEGRPVIVTRNDPDIGVFNGDIGIALRTSAGDANLRVHFADGPTMRSIGVGRLGHVETAFAMTVHKSQGSEFDHTVLVLPPDGNAVTTRELVYTGITRARSAFTLVASRRRSLFDAIAQTTRRSSGLMGFIRDD